MVKQVVYCAEQAWEMVKDTDPSGPLPKVKFLINTRGGGFRPPDKDYRAAVFDGARPILYFCVIGCWLLAVDVWITIMIRRPC